MRSKLLLATVFFMLATASPALAVFPDCGPYQAPSPACRPAFVNNEPVTIAIGRPFAWIRKTPSSTSAFTYTAPVGMVFLVQRPALDSQAGHWDGYQWWFPVKGFSPSRAQGWIEQASLYPVGDNTKHATAVIKSSIPFVWIRLYPSSSGPILLTIFPRRSVTILGDPMFNEGQNWLNIRYSDGSRTFQGYIEQSAVSR